MAQLSQGSGRTMAQQLVANLRQQVTQHGTTMADSWQTYGTVVAQPLAADLQQQVSHHGTTRQAYGTSYRTIMADGPQSGVKDWTLDMPA